MFSGNSVALSEFDGKYGIRVKRDCDFSYIGKVPTRLHQRLVACAAPRHIESAITEEGIAGVLCPPDLADSVPEQFGVAVADNPLLASHRIHRELCERPGFFWDTFPTEIHPTAVIHPLAHVASRDVVIGAHCHVGPFTLIEERSVIKDNVRIGPHCAIGWDAFEVDADKSNPRVLPHAGGVLIEENVEILSHCAIAKNAFGGFNTIGASSKLDCLIVVTHDAILGRNVKVAGGVTICGRAEIGNDVFIGPQSVISNGVKVGDGATITIGAVVTRDVNAGEKVTGNLAMPHAKWMKFMASAT